MSQPAIRVHELGKKYRIIHETRGRYKTLRETVMAAAAAPVRWMKGERGTTSEEFWALKDVSFEVQPGEVVGIIGRNGAGKSTLLKVLSRITKPTKGRIELNGRVGSLLEVGTGFHPELTGRENVYLNGSILGMARREIERKFDEIVAFAEVEKFLDTPVKRYSSGMYVRLAFAVAAHLEPEILIVDEVLAVGDASFQKKCMGKMREVGRSGRTVLFVSHNMAAVTNLCDRGVLLAGGQTSFCGSTADCVATYSKGLSSTNGGNIDLSDHRSRRTTSNAVLERLRLLNSSGIETDTFECGERMTMELVVNLRGEVWENPELSVGFDDASGQRVFSVATFLAPRTFFTLQGQRYVRCVIDRLDFAAGAYSLSIGAGTTYKPLIDALYNAVGIEVIASDFYGNGRFPHSSLGAALVRSDWTLAE
jgi:lipopolysaccharide transport system ATP-binding protein